MAAAPRRRGYGRAGPSPAPAAGAGDTSGRRRRGPADGAANARRDVELWLALRESARRGNAWVNLPLDGPTELEQRLQAEYRRRYGSDPLEGAETLTEAPFDRLSVMWTVAGWL